MLINYLPPILQEIKEFKVLMADGDEENNKLYSAIADLEKNQYVTSVNENYIKRYENMLKITAKGTDTIEDRRFRILSLYNKQLPYTYIRLQKDLVTLCGTDGFTISLDYEEHILTVKVTLTAKEMFNIVQEYLDSVVPMNIIINLLLLYNQHLTLSKQTHEQLKKYTQQQVRDEVLT